MPKRNIAWIIIVVTIAVLMWQLPQMIAGRDSVYRAFGALVDVRAQIRKRFVGKVSDEELIDASVDAGIRAMVDTLHDPYAVYLNPEQYENFRDRTQGIFGGVGVEVWGTDTGLEVLGFEPGSPAEKAGIGIGDVITEIDGKSMAGVPVVEAASEMLNGSPGTTLQLTLRRTDGDGETLTETIAVTRSVIHLDPVRGWSRTNDGQWRLMLDSAARIGYVRLTKFTQDAAEKLDHALDRLRAEQVRGLVLDLRENTGGLLPSAIDVADRFLADGLIVSTRGRKAAPQEWHATREQTYPESLSQIVVLVNGSTASAAEIVAGALQDNSRATVVGERSYGKGSVQEVIELTPMDRSHGALKLTTAYYYLPLGRCIQRTREMTDAGTWGVEPTVPVQLTKEQRERWLRTWRAIGHELIAEAPSDDGESDGAETKPAEGRVQEALRQLLGADPQLERAIEVLKLKTEN